MRWILVIVVACMSGPLAPMRTSRAWGQTTRPVEAADRVVLISIDGLRPDLLLRANTPNLRALMKRGSYSMWARTIPEAITLPSHTSMLTGVSMKVHGITWNGDRPAEQRIAPKVPTLFQLARQHGLSTAIAAGKSKFVTLAEDGVDISAVPSPEARLNDTVVATTAARMIEIHQPRVLFVHLPSVDGAGHGIGWGTPQQIEAIERADAAVGLVVSAIESAGLIDQTVIIVSADHGGAGRGHGKDDARSRHIPWIAAGPGIRQDFDLTRISELVINTQDTFATACYFLGIPIPEHSEGKPITQILLDPQPLNAPAATAQ